MVTFYIQEQDDSLTRVSHDEFYELLDEGSGYLHYEQGGVHMALLPTERNTETMRVCRKSDNAVSAAIAAENRCRDEKGRVCRNQHDENGKLVLNEKGKVVAAKCNDCPRNGWSAGSRNNCCLRNYCKIEDCVYCPHPRKCHTPLSLDLLIEDKPDYDECDGGGFAICDVDADIQSVFEDSELKSTLLTALGELSKNERAVLKAIYWDKLTLRDIAAKSSMSKSTISRLHAKALKALKNILEEFR